MKTLQHFRFALLFLATAGCDFRPPPPDGSGTIDCTQVQVAPLVAGRILSLPTQEGDVVKRGDIIARLDSADYELKRNEARAALQLADAQLALMQAGSRTEDIQKARAQVAEAQAVAKASRADLERVQSVYDKNSATARQRDDAQALADRTAAALAAAEQGLEKLVHGNRQEDISIAQAQVDLAKAKLAQAEKAVADCTVMAPMAGVVTTRSHEDGEFVGIGAALVTLSRLDEVWLSAYIPENRVAGVKLGQKAQVAVDGVVQRFDGTVTFIASEAEFTPRNVQTPDERAKLVYRVKITLPNPKNVFKPGMPADAFLVHE